MLMNPKYVDVVMCEGCNVALLDYDECDSCIECEACGVMTPPRKLDSQLLLESEIEICTSCTESWWDEPTEEKPTMAGFNGE